MRSARKTRLIHCFSKVSPREPSAVTFFEIIFIVAYLRTLDLQLEMLREKKKCVNVASICVLNIKQI